MEPRGHFGIRHIPSGARLSQSMVNLQVHPTSARLQRPEKLFSKSSILRFLEDEIHWEILQTVQNLLNMANLSGNL